MRLDGTFGYPWPLTMGALGNDTLVYRVGRRIGEACRQMGIYANFAPSADVNTEPENPIIGVRSFGEDPHRVAGKVAAFVRGMQDAGVLASVKHFPGHGGTSGDSHDGAVSTDKTLEELMAEGPVDQCQREQEVQMGGMA